MRVVIKEIQADIIVLNMSFLVTTQYKNNLETFIGARI